MRTATLGVAACLLAALAGSLAGCTSMTRMSADAPANVNLAGTWKLDPKSSTDTRKALDDLMKAARRTPGPRARAGGLGGYGSDAALLAPPPMVFAPDISLQKRLLAHGDWLKIVQKPDEVVISDGDSSRSFVPGERSVVSVPGGVADQRTGWKGREYWIVLKPQAGPTATETFKLSAGGMQLIETIEIGRDGRIPSLKVTRVYSPTQEEPPSAVPSQD